MLKRAQELAEQRRLRMAGLAPQTTRKLKFRGRDIPLPTTAWSRRREKWRSVALPTLGMLLIGYMGTTVMQRHGVTGNPNERAAARDQEMLTNFRIGPASDWDRPGVHLDYLESQRTILVVHKDMLVALDATSTEADVSVIYDQDAGLYRCPRSGALWDTNGLPIGNSTASRALERCNIRTLGPIDDPDVELLVDARVRFLFEDNVWSKIGASYLFPRETIPDRDRLTRR